MDGGDTTFTKLFVGGLAWQTQRDEMQRYFQQFGDIAEAVVIADKHTGRSRGYGFVRSESRRSVVSCELKLPCHVSSSASFAIRRMSGDVQGP